MDTEGQDPAAQDQLQRMRGSETPAGLRPVLLTLLQTGGVPPQMAEGIADILEEAGYQEFRPMDDVTLRRRNARALASTPPDSLCEALSATSARLTDDPVIRATHSRITFERLAAQNHTHDKPAPMLLTQDMRTERTSRRHHAKP